MYRIVKNCYRFELAAERAGTYTAYTIIIYDVYIERDGTVKRRLWVLTVMLLLAACGQAEAGLPMKETEERMSTRRWLPLRLSRG